MPSSITLNPSGIAPLRDALYSCLTNSTDVLNSALTRPERETSSLVHTAYLEIATLAEMLDRIGWQHTDQQEPLTISTTADARLIVEALTIELQVEEDLALSRHKAGEHAGAEASSNRTRVLHDALSRIGADAAAAGLLDTGRS